MGNKRKGKRLLSINEMKNVNLTMKEIFIYIKKINSGRIISIKNPQIPAPLSESLALHLLKRGLIPELEGFSFDFGGSDSDIKAVNGEKTLKIEVKATSEKEFQKFTKKDVKANYLIWINFDKFHKVEEDVPINAFIIKDPKKQRIKIGRITLDKLKKNNKLKFIEKEIDLDSLYQ